MPAPTAAPVIDLSFPHLWQARILPARPAILPMRHYVYPRHAEEIERGALELLIQPLPELEPGSPGAPGLGSPRTGPRPGGGDLALETWESRSHHPGRDSALPFLATCALGFRDPSVPTGLWSTPSLTNSAPSPAAFALSHHTPTDPEHFTMLPYRPVPQLLPPPPQKPAPLPQPPQRSFAWGRPAKPGKQKTSRTKASRSPAWKPVTPRVTTRTPPVTPPASSAARLAGSPTRKISSPSISAPACIAQR